MKKLTWTLQIVLALAFAAAGFIKVTTPRAGLMANGMAWVEDFSDLQVQLIGAAEIAGAIGLILPVATGIAPVLTPLAGVGLALIMGGAVMTHLQRSEPMFVPLVLGLLAATVAYLRFRAKG